MDAKTWFVIAASLVSLVAFLFLIHIFIAHNKLKKDFADHLSEMKRLSRNLISMMPEIDEKARKSEPGTPK